MNTKDLILVGGGGHCKAVIDVAEAAGYHILGILDMPGDVGRSVLGYQVIGTDDDIPRYAGKAEFVVTVGFIKSPAVRIRLYDRIKAAGGRLATLVAPTAHVSRFASIGEGTVVMHRACINADAKVGANCIINTCCNIEHDVEIGNQCHISTGAMVNGGCKTGDRVFVGSQSVLVQGVTVADDLIVGAASFVHKSIKTKGIYSGNPARLVIKL